MKKLIFFIISLCLAVNPVIAKVSDEMVLIREGEFIMGIDEKGLQDIFPEQMWAGGDRDIFLNEVPRHEVYLDDYLIDKYPVTLREFMEFIHATDHQMISVYLNKLLIQAEKTPQLFDSPVIGVSWFDAKAYAKYAGKRLPTEAEWEKAARGVKGRIYSWGNEYEIQNEAINEVARLRREQYASRFLPVGHKAVAFDRSEFGVYYMNNPPSEWTKTPYQAYQGNSYPENAYGRTFNLQDPRGKPFSAPAYVIKKCEVDIMGADYANPHYLRYCLLTPFRGYATPEYSSALAGFRCAKDVEKKGVIAKLTGWWQTYRKKSSLEDLYQKSQRE